MTTPDPDHGPRATRRRHIARLTGKPRLTASERTLLARLQRLDDADQAPADDDTALRQVLGLAPDETPAATRTR